MLEVVPEGRVRDEHDRAVRTWRRPEVLRGEAGQRHQVTGDPLGQHGIGRSNQLESGGQAVRRPGVRIPRGAAEAVVVVPVVPAERPEGALAAALEAEGLRVVVAGAGTEQQAWLAVDDPAAVVDEAGTGDRVRKPGHDARCGLDELLSTCHRARRVTGVNGMAVDLESELVVPGLRDVAQDVELPGEDVDPALGFPLLAEPVGDLARDSLAARVRQPRGRVCLLEQGQPVGRQGEAVGLPGQVVAAVEGRVAGSRGSYLLPWPTLVGLVDQVVDLPVVAGGRLSAQVGRGREEVGDAVLEERRVGGVRPRVERSLLRQHRPSVRRLRTGAQRGGSTDDENQPCGKGHDEATTTDTHRTAAFLRV